MFLAVKEAYEVGRKGPAVQRLPAVAVPYARWVANLPQPSFAAPSSLRCLHRAALREEEAERTAWGSA